MIKKDAARVLFICLVLLLFPRRKWSGAFCDNPFFLVRRLFHRHRERPFGEPDQLVDVENGSDPQFGARPLKRFIQSHAESLLARYIIRESPAEGTTLTLDVNETGLTVR